MFKTIRYAAIFSLGLLATLSTPAFSAKRPPADYVDPVTGMEFMAIPGGTFTMGDNHDEAARPEHAVTIKPFLLGRYEVTFEQYAKFCVSTGRQIPSDGGWGMNNRPVINVTWQDAVDFTTWLSKISGKTFRLPSEAEWEYAARGRATTKFPWGNKIGKSKANCNGCGSEWDNKMTSPVGSFAPNSYGIYDMVGNVYEWCLDIKHNNYEGAPNDGSPWLTDGQEDTRINRGGSWFQLPSDAVPTARCWEHSARGQNDYGFRVLMAK